MSMKNFLTHQFAVNYVREATIASIAPEVKERLMASAHQMLDQFAQSIRAEHPLDEAKALFVSLLSLRDCADILAKAGVRIPEIEGNYSVLHRRLEQLCADATYRVSRTKPLKLFG